MPLNADVLAGLMRANMDALSDSEKADRDKTLKALAAAVVAHVTSAGLVTVTGTATGALAGGPGVPVVGTGLIS
jgi:hypothetical protein